MFNAFRMKFSNFYKVYNNFILNFNMFIGYYRATRKYGKRNIIFSIFNGYELAKKSHYERKFGMAGLLSQKHANIRTYYLKHKKNGHGIAVTGDYNDLFEKYNNEWEFKEPMIKNYNDEWDGSGNLRKMV